MIPSRTHKTDDYINRIRLTACSALLMKKLFIIFMSILVCAAPGLADLNPVSLPYLMQEQFNGHDLTLVKVIEKNGFYTKYYINYKSGNLKISGIMDVPKGPGPFPVIITCHGHINTRVYVTGRGLKREQDYLAKHGYVVLHPDYRNHDGSDKDLNANLNLNIGYTADVINAIYAIKKSDFKFINKEKIGLLGHSLGGGIALNIMVAKPGLVQAYVLFAPISSDYRDNYKRWILRHGEQKFGPPQTTRKIIEKYGSPESDPEFWDNMSAKTFFDNIKSPVMLHQGLSDKSVPPQWSVNLAKMLKEKNKNITFYEYPGEPHEFINAWPLVMKRSIDFFDSYLK